MTALLFSPNFYYFHFKEYVKTFQSKPTLNRAFFKITGRKQLWRTANGKLVNTLSRNKPFKVAYTLMQVVSIKLIKSVHSIILYIIHLFILLSESDKTRRFYLKNTSMLFNSISFHYFEQKLWEIHVFSIINKRLQVSMILCSKV